MGKFFGFARGVFFGIPAFAIAAFGHAISYASYSSLKDKGKRSAALPAFRDWVLPYEPRSYWERRAQNYIAETQAHARELPGASRQQLHDAMIAALGKINFNSLLEAGCGYGRNLKLISDSFSGKKLSGIDFSSGMISNAKNFLKIYPQISLSKQDLCSTQFRNGSFDAVLCCETLMHVPKQQIRHAIDEMIRVAGRYIVVIEPDLARTPFFNRLLHAQHVFFHNYPNLFRSTKKAKPFWNSEINYQFRNVYIFKKA